MKPMQLKSIFLPLLLITLSACALTPQKSNESLQLMDGSTLVIENNYVIKMTDNTGEIISIKKGAMIELNTGNYLYIRLDGTVQKININNASNNHHGHSH